MRCSIFLLMLLTALFGVQHSAAQDTDYVYKDSSAIVDSGQIVQMSNTKITIVKEGDSEDTLLKNKRLALVNDSAEALKKLPAFAYAKNLDSLLKDLQQKQEKQVVTQERTGPSWLERFFFSAITKIFFWSLGIFFIGFILYKLFFAQGIFQRQTAGSKVSIISEKEEENLSATTDYNKLIAQAVSNKNYRMATRYHYLQTLQKLAVKGAIQFTADKTNHQYITELFGKPYKDAFTVLTLNYEYAWYGGFQLNEMVFAKIQHNFTAFNNQL